MDMTTLGKVIGTGKYIWFPPTILPFPVSRSKVQEQDGPRSPHCMRWPRHESVRILSFCPFLFSDSLDVYRNWVRFHYTFTTADSPNPAFRVTNGRLVH